MPRIHKELSVRLQLATIFEASTVGTLAGKVRATDRTSTSSSPNSRAAPQCRARREQRERVSARVGCPRRR